nr:hypothetical protein [Tanacetum cinerariifolium]
MDLLSFIRTANPTKVRVAERQRVKDKPRLLESTLFDEGASGDGQGTDIQLVITTTDTIVGDVVPLQPRRQRKRKTAVADASRPSHPPKKLREDYGALGGAFTAGKSMFAVQSLFTGAVLNAEARGEPILTLPFVTSSVSDSSHRSGANIAEAEVDSIFRSSAPAIATVTTVTAAVDADTTADRVPVKPSLFGVGSSSTGRTDSVPGGFFDVSGSDFLIGDEFALPKFFASVREMDHDQLFTEFNVGVARQISLSAEAELLKVRDGEIEILKAQLLLKEAEATEAIQREKNELSVKVTDLSASVKVREQEVADLDAQVTAVKLQNDNFVDQVHKLEISSSELQEKVAAYEDFIGHLEKFQDKKMEEVNEKFGKLCADFVYMAFHLEEKFYPHLLTTIFGRRWLLTHGMELGVVRCLNSIEYLSALRAAISKAVEKGMQEGISAGITHAAKADGSYPPFSGSTRRWFFHFIPFLGRFSLPGTEGTSGSSHDTTTTLSVTFVSAGTVPPISTDDYEVAHADGQGVPVWIMKPQLLGTLIFSLMLATQS